MTAAAELSTTVDVLDDEAPAWLAWRAGYVAGRHDGVAEGRAEYEAEDAASWAVMAAIVRGVAASPDHAELVRRRSEVRWNHPAHERCARARERLSEAEWWAGVRRSWDLPAREVVSC